jgi:hypothetical protein
MRESWDMTERELAQWIKFAKFVLSGKKAGLPLS